MDIYSEWLIGACCSLRVIGSVYTYFFLVSQTDGVTLYHPLLPQPTDMEDDPLIVRINFLERDADRKDIIASILRFDYVYVR